ncbi:hypothetical protein ZWY2020_003123 [Hordeum vulgare]|nr:hypothetical protein ZWY2020_003123 [Hordeum vulgare]
MSPTEGGQLLDATACQGVGFNVPGQSGQSPDVDHVRVRIHGKGGEERLPNGPDALHPAAVVDLELHVDPPACLGPEEAAALGLRPPRPPLEHAPLAVDVAELALPPEPASHVRLSIGKCGENSLVDAAGGLDSAALLQLKLDEAAPQLVVPRVSRRARLEFRSLRLGGHLCGRLLCHRFDVSIRVLGFAIYFYGKSLIFMSDGFDR